MPETPDVLSEPLATTNAVVSFIQLRIKETPFKPADGGCCPANGDNPRTVCGATIQ